MCVSNVVEKDSGKVYVLSCSLSIQYVLYHFKTLNHDVHILKAFANHLI